jgi:hypothetical protein
MEFRIVARMPESMRCPVETSRRFFTIGVYVARYAAGVKGGADSRL